MFVHIHYFRDPYKSPLAQHHCSNPSVIMIVFRAVK